MDGFRRRIEIDEVKLRRKVVMIFVYITCKDQTEAKKIAKEILEKKLAVCANIFPIESMYWWEGKIQEGQEAVLILKTLKQNYQTVKREIEGSHSYDTPFIGSIKLHQVSGPFYAHLKRSVKKYYGKKSPLAKPTLKTKKK